MTDSDKRDFAETVFEREQRREKEISSALKRAKLRRATAQARANPLADELDAFHGKRFPPDCRRTFGLRSYLKCIR
jgi:hypothetical protein